MMETTRLGFECTLWLAHEGGSHADRGQDSRSVHIDLTAAGTLDLSRHDTGPSVRRAWADNVFEYGVEFAAVELPKLAFALVAEHYAGNLDAVSKITKLVQRHGIETERWDWAW